MKIFSCSTCNQTVFFENVRCTRCGGELAYLPDYAIMSALEPRDGFLVATAPAARAQRYKLCQNSIDHGVCNWAVPWADEVAYCRGCRLNNIIPDLSHPGALVAWGRIERAKKRLLYTLFDLCLPINSYPEKKGGLVFSFKESDVKSASPLLTGHDEWHITLNIAEADNPGREKLREQLGEPYRTLVGHFRHEIGHYYWNALIRNTDQLGPFIDLFGDPFQSYEAALQRHYQEGPPRDWQASFVSNYATMHPWEDWAETWAHYLHMVDALGTARSYGMVLSPPPLDGAGAPDMSIDSVHVDFDDFEDLIQAWFPLTMALNSLNRGMGLPDAYPFVLSERAIKKLRFVHNVVERARQKVGPEPALAKTSTGQVVDPEDDRNPGPMIHDSRMPSPSDARVP